MFTTTVERLEGDDAGVYAAHLRRTRHRRIDELPRPVRGTAHELSVDHVVFALGYRVQPPPGTETIGFPLRRTEQHDALLDRRWLASGIMAGQRSVERTDTGPRSRVGWLALEREVGLAVASSQSRPAGGRGLGSAVVAAKTPAGWAGGSGAGAAATPRASPPPRRHGPRECG